MAAAIAAATCPVPRVEAALFHLDTVLVGHAGNAPDPLTGLGAVSYQYHIGATEVTNAQYASLLNAVDPGGTNPHDLYNPNMTNATGFAVVKGGLDYNPAATESRGVGGRHDDRLVSGGTRAHCTVASRMERTPGAHRTQRYTYQAPIVFIL